MARDTDTAEDDDEMVVMVERESDTARNGFLSYPAEWHAFVIGTYYGLTTKPWRRTPPIPEHRDVSKELHYYKGGYVFGSILQVALTLLLIRYGVAPAILGNTGLAW